MSEKPELAEYRAADVAMREFKEKLKAAAAYDVAGILKDNNDLESGPMYAIDVLNRTRDENLGSVTDAAEDLEYALTHPKTFEATMSVTVKDLKEKQKKLLKSVDLIIKDLKPRTKAPKVAKTKKAPKAADADKKGGKKTKKNRTVRGMTYGRRV